MIDFFRLERVHYIPETLESGVLYMAAEFDIAVHLCACGCATKVTTPLGLAEWQITPTATGPSLSPSIGNWQLPCRSHYFITAGKTRWAGQWSDERVQAGRDAEKRRREAYYNERANNRKPMVRFVRWLRSLF